MYMPTGQVYFFFGLVIGTFWNGIDSKVIREKSRGEGSLIVQDTIENVSEPNFFFNFLRKKNYIF